MKKFVTLLFLFSVFMQTGTLDFAQHKGVPVGFNVHQEVSGFESMPLHFVENRGQVNNTVKYFVSIPQGSIYLTSQGLTYQFLYPEKSENIVRENNVKMSFLGANKNPRIEGLEKSGARMNYFLGDDPDEWVSGAPSYFGIRYHELYPRIDLMVYGREGRFKQEYLVRAGGSVKDIRIHYQGAESVQINDKGQLEIFTQQGVIREDVPFSYQLIDGQKVEVETAYSIEEGNTLSFVMGEYRRDENLIIDPELLYTTFLGGRSWDVGYEMHYDEEGNAYVTGETASSDFPTKAGSFDRSFNSNHDAFVSKLDAEGKNLIFSTFLGGSRDDWGDGIKVDSAGNVYVSGSTDSPNFPTKKAYDKTYNGDLDCFVTILNSKGKKLLYSTYLGGNSEDEGIALDIYEANTPPASVADITAKYASIYVIVETSSSNFPVTNGAYDTTSNGGEDIAVVSLNQRGKLSWSTFLGGRDEEDAEWITVDEAKNVYITGYTESKDFPTSEFAYDRSFNGGEDAFAAKFSPDGKTLLGSTFFGGKRDERSESIEVDEDGNILIAGETDSDDLPTTKNAYKTKYIGGEYDGFLVKFTQMFESLVFSTYFGGSKEEEVEEMVIDAVGRIYLTGDTDSNNFPVTKDAHQKNLRGGQDAYLSLLSADGTSLLYSTFLGGSYEDDSSLLGIDSSGNCYIGGWTESPDFPTTQGVVDREFRGYTEAWVAKFKFPAAGPTSLSGTVTDKETGLPIWNATIKLIGKTVKGVKVKIKSAKDGSFIIDSLEPGIYKLAITKKDYKKYVVKKITVDGPTKHDVEMAKK